MSSGRPSFTELDRTKLVAMRGLVGLLGSQVPSEQRRLSRLGRLREQDFLAVARPHVPAPMIAPVLPWLLFMPSPVHGGHRLSVMLAPVGHTCCGYSSAQKGTIVCDTVHPGSESRTVISSVCAPGSVQK